MVSPDSKASLLTSHYSLPLSLPDHPQPLLRPTLSATYGHQGSYVSPDGNAGLLES